jgi:hypothetical protein
VHLLYLCIYFACACHLLDDVLAATCLQVMMLLNPKELTASMYSMSLLGLRFLCLFKHPLPAYRDHLQSQCQYPNFKTSTNRQHEIIIENALRNWKEGFGALSSSPLSFYLYRTDNWGLFSRYTRLDMYSKMSRRTYRFTKRAVTANMAINPTITAKSQEGIRRQCLRSQLSSTKPCHTIN